jgi:hypothetical protein
MPSGFYQVDPSGNLVPTENEPAATSRGGIDPYTMRLWQIEAGPGYAARAAAGQRVKVPYTGSNGGLGQFGPEEERMYGLHAGNRDDPQAQADALQRELEHHTPILTEALGREPEDWEKYLMHQQGIAGGPALLTADPDTPAWQVILPYYQNYRDPEGMAKRAIKGNIDKDNPLKQMPAERIAAGAFNGYWQDKWNSGTPGYSSGSPSMQAGIGVGSPAGPVAQAGETPEETAGIGVGSPAGMVAQAGEQPGGGVLGTQVAAPAPAAAPQTQGPLGAIANLFGGGGMPSNNLAALLQQTQAPPMQPILPPMQPMQQSPFQLRPPQVDYSGLQRLLSGQRGFA